MRMRLYPALLLAALLPLATGCRRGHDHGHDHRPAPGTSQQSHVHAAPNGGVLLELGDHAHNLEIVTRTGGFDLFVLDGHAQNFIPLAVPAIPATAVIADRQVPIAFLAQASPASGETVGNTSHFAAPWPEAVSPTEIRIDSLSIQGATYRNIVLLPKPPGTISPATANER